MQAMVNKHNPGYSGGFPVAVGDRYYSQDIFRDFYYLLEKSGLAIEDLISSIPFLVSGGYCVKGTNWDDMDITAAVGYHEFDVTSPDSFASIPPTTKTDTLRAQRVESTAQTDFDISGATLDGATVNYLKLEFVTTSGNSRTRAKKAGSYNYELVDSFLFTADSTPGTSKQVTIATFVGDGSSSLTITNIEPVNLAKLYLDTIYQDDSRLAVLKPAGSILWEFSSPSLANSNGLLPSRMFGIQYLPSTDSNARFSKRGIFRTDSGMLIYDYSFGNAVGIKFRFKPTFVYNSGEKFLFDTRGFTLSSDDYFYFLYDGATQKYKFVIMEDASNKIEILSDAYASDVALQVWTDIVITLDKTNNDDADAKGNAQMFIDGVIMDGGSNGTKTKTGNGIANINMAAIDFVIGKSGFAINSTAYGDGYFTDMLIFDGWNEDVSNYDGTGLVKPNYAENRIAGINHNHITSEYGNRGLTSLDCNAINNGGGIERTFVLKIGSWNMNISIGGTSQVNIGIPSYVPSDWLLKPFIMYATIINDNLNQSYPMLDIISGTPSIYVFSPTTIRLTVTTGSLWDSTNFDDTSINRGWVIVKYIA
jgi:hypothetical protein